MSEPTPSVTPSPAPSGEPAPVPEARQVSAPASFAAEHPTLMYTLSRILIFLAVFGVLYLVGARDLVLLVLAFLLSGAVSLVLLSRQRDAMSTSVSGRFSRMNARIEESKRAEDDV